MTIVLCHVVVCFRFLAIMKVHFGDYYDFNDLPLWLAFNLNKYELSHNPGKDTKLPYKAAVHILVVYSYNQAVQYLCEGGVHKGHRQVLGMLFLEIARFFGNQFRNKEMTNKW